MTLDELAQQLSERQKAWGLIDGYSIIGDLVQPLDRGEDFLTSTNYYSWYFLLGYILKPRRIAEFGVRYGYSIKALTSGGWSACTYENEAGEPYATTVWGVDDERDGEKTLHVFEDYFKKVDFLSYTLTRQDTQKLNTYDIPEAFRDSTDLVHVDAWHTEDGCYHECGLAWSTAKPGGFVVVDDAKPGGVVRKGVDRFCLDNQLNSVYFDTLRGMVIFQTP